jgi:hypothetical protein
MPEFERGGGESDLLLLAYDTSQALTIEMANFELPSASRS